MPSSRPRAARIASPSSSARRRGVARMSCAARPSRSSASTCGASCASSSAATSTPYLAATSEIHRLSMEDGRKKYGTKFRIGEMAVRIAEKDGCADGCRDGCKDRKLNIIIENPITKDTDQKKVTKNSKSSLINQTKPKISQNNPLSSTMNPCHGKAVLQSFSLWRNKRNSKVLTMT